jgi:hypothetical protein
MLRRQPGSGKLKAANAQAQRSAAWMLRNKGTLSFRLDPSLLSEATTARALQLVVSRRPARRLDRASMRPVAVEPLKEAQ